MKRNMEIQQEVLEFKLNLSKVSSKRRRQLIQACIFNLPFYLSNSEVRMLEKNRVPKMYDTLWYKLILDENDIVTDLLIYKREETQDLLARRIKLRNAI